MFIGSPRNFSSKIGDKPVLINNAPVPHTETFTCLGVKLDGKLNWDNHIDSICQKVSAGIGIMRRIKPYFPRKTLLDIFNGLVMPYFDYVPHYETRVAKGCKINYKNIITGQPGSSVEIAMRFDLQTSWKV